MSLQADHTEDPTTVFVFESLLGEGSYGCVYKALDTRDNQLVAIKVIEKETDDAASLLREVEMLRQCSSTYIVRFKGSFEKDGFIWIIMEYCHAGSINDLVTICDVQLTEQHISRILQQCLLGLQYLHASNKIHRDIKGANVLLNERGHVKLADFGVAAQLTNTQPKRATQVGTPYWIAPEVLLGSPYNGSADIWSLGVTAIELAMGDPPLSNIHPMKALFEIPNRPAPRLPKVGPSGQKWSDEFRDFVRQCCQKDPEKRPSCTILLRHKFVAHARRGKLRSLVRRCLPVMEEFRDLETAEIEKKHGTGISRSSIGTLARSSMGGTLPMSKPVTVDSIATTDDGADEKKQGPGLRAQDVDGMVNFQSKQGIEDEYVSFRKAKQQRQKEVGGAARQSAKVQAAVSKQSEEVEDDNDDWDPESVSSASNLKDNLPPPPPPTAPAAKKDSGGKARTRIPKRKDEAPVSGGAAAPKRSSTPKGKRSKSQSRKGPPPAGGKEPEQRRRSVVDAQTASSGAKKRSKSQARPKK